MVRMLWGLVRKGAPAAEDESVERYARRRFGDEAARRMFDPLVSGIFAGDPARLSYASALARFGKRRGETASFAGGMGALPAALAKALGTALRLGTRVVALARARPGSGADPGGGRWSVRLASGEMLGADDVVLTSPAHASADLVAPLDEALGAELRAIRYAPVTAVLLGYDASAFPAGAPRGFGFLAAREEGLPILGCLFVPAPPGKVALRPMLSGSRADAVEVARRSVEPILGCTGAPEVAEVVRHERAIPQYELEHARRLRTIDARLASLPGLRLSGSAYRGVSVPDVIADGRRVAEEIAAARSA
jgi:oxygen-dependent protoporphyrinogen oxidase